MIGALDHALWYGEMPLADFLQNCSPRHPLVQGRGVRVRDLSGRWLLDARSSLWNVTLGYGEERILRAMRRQLDALPFATVLGYERPSAVAVEYADALASRLSARYRKIRFGCTGAQAVEAAILLSRFVRKATGEPERTHVVSLEEGYHGFGGLASVLTGVDGSYGPLAPGVRRVPPPYCLRCPWGLRYPGCGVRCETALEEAVAEIGPERVTAVIVEPIVGSLGLVPPPEYLPRLAGFCRAAGVHLVIDETSTGFGRVGALTRAEQVGVEPDMLILGKGITSGYAPLSAVAVSQELFEQLCGARLTEPFMHGSTSDAHPAAMAAALAVLEVLDQDEVLAHVAPRARTLAEGLEGLRARHPVVREVRGTGLLQAVELADPEGDRPWTFEEVTRLRLACEAHGVLVSAGHNSIAVVPPLIVSDEDCAEIVDALDRALSDVAVAG